MTDRKLAYRARSNADPAVAADAPLSHVEAPLRVPVPATTPLLLRSGSTSTDALGGTQAAPEVISVLHRRRGQGRALPADAASRFGEAYGSDLSGVRVHTDRESDHIARSVEATAFTHGSDVYFSAGAYAPGSASGDRLLAHELAHVAQHRRGEFGPSGAGATTVGRANDPAEAAADRMAQGALGAVRRSPAPAAHSATVDDPAALRRSFFSRRGKEEQDSVANQKNPDYKKKVSSDTGLGVPALAEKMATADKYTSTPDGKFSGASSKSKRDNVDKIKGREKTKELHQPVDDLGEIYAHVEMLEAAFRHTVEGIAADKSCQGSPLFRPDAPVKGLERAEEKLGAAYKGDASRLVDLCGGTIKYDNPDDLINGFGLVNSNPMFKVVRIKNSLAKGKMYGDINLSIEMAGGMDYVDDNGKKQHYAGFIVELQLHLAPIANTKEHAHKEYEKQRTIEAKYGDKSPKDARYTAEDKAAWQDLQTKMDVAYGAAWAEVGAAELTTPAVVAQRLAAAIPARGLR